MNDHVLDQYYFLEKELLNLIPKIRFSAELNLRLERIKLLLDFLGNPQEELTTIHVGGTSGKGSTSTMISAVFSSAGYHVGLHTSPHLQVLNERHQINNRYVPTSKLVRYWQEIAPAIKAVGNQSPFGLPSYFEAQLALSLHTFAQENVDLAIIEVGLGGTLDATNIVEADVAVITNVGLDHTEILGNSEVQIAKDKAGIIKIGQRVVSGCKQPEVRQVIQDRCQLQNSDLWEIEEDFWSEPEANSNSKWSLVGPGYRYNHMKLGLQGQHQVNNATVAIAAVMRLSQCPVTEQAIINGIKNSHLPGRVEIIQKSPLVILDGAHNHDKIQASARIVSEKKATNERQKIWTIIGVKQNKALSDMLPSVIALSDHITATEFSDTGLWNSIPAAHLASEIHVLQPDLPLTINDDALEALQSVLSKAKTSDLVWITGSLYLAGEIRSHWYPKDRLLVQLEDYH